MNKITTKQKELLKKWFLNSEPTKFQFVQDLTINQWDKLINIDNSQTLLYEVQDFLNELNGNCLQNKKVKKMIKYLILCKLYEPENNINKMVFYMKSYENAKKAKELFDTILGDWYSQWTVDIGNDDETERVKGVIEELIELGVSFEQEQMGYFIPPIYKIDILEYNVIN